MAWRQAVLVTIAAGCAAEVAPPGELATHVDDWRDEVIYEIVVDRFDNADADNDWLGDVGPVPGDLKRHQGGDWAGVRRRLDYVERLGATAIWLSPIVANIDRTDYQDGYHGYWASTFAELNPRFGDLDELRGLVDDAHARDLKVIIDVVINHAGRVFYYDFDGDGELDKGEAEPRFAMAEPYDADTVTWLVPPPEVWRDPGDGGAPTRVTLDADAFHRRGQTTDGTALQKQLGDFPTGLRDLHTEDDQLVADLVDTYVHWVELTDVDGFRLDAVPHAPHELWDRFARALRAELAARGKHRFLLLGEVFSGNPAVLAPYTAAGGLDSVFDFSLKDRVIEGFILDGEPASVAVNALEGNRSYYPAVGHENGVELSPWQARVAFADNHDMPRLRYWLDDPWAAELAMTVIFTVDAIPAVYYGTEQGLAGGWQNASREPLWTTGFAEDGRTFRHIARLAQIRRASEALRRGGLRVVYASEISARDQGAGAGLLAYERFTDDQRVLIALSGHPAERTSAVFDTGFAPGTRLRDALSGQTVAVDVNGRVLIDLPPREAVILMPE